tara:strand:- start:6209 stop:6976 length:768 start_codon:yes stop_codon:yes gene_type:complete
MNSPDKYDISNLEVISTKNVGPLTLDEWIEYNSIHKFNTNQLLDKRIDILKEYPRFKYINIVVTEYKKNDETGIRKISYSITQHIPTKVQKNNTINVNLSKKNSMDWRTKDNINQEVKEPSNWRENTKTIDKNRDKGFKLFNISESSKDRLNNIKVLNNDRDKKTKNKTVVIKNIPNNFKDHNEIKGQLRNILGEYGAINKIDIFDNNKRKLMGFIDFYSEESVKTVLEESKTKKFRLNNQIIDICEKKIKLGHK